MKSQAKQWINKHLRSMETTPDGRKLLTFRIDSLVVPITIPADTWYNALLNHELMNDLRDRVIYSMRGRSS